MLIEAMPASAGKENRQRKTKFPCPRCGIGVDRCICSSIPLLHLASRVVLVVHAKELKRTTNTGRLALEALSNKEMRVRGRPGDRAGDVLDLSDLLSERYQSLLFFPGEGAEELTPELVAKFDRPVQLIVPDGNWRQASKVAIRHPELAALPRVMICSPNRAEHHLRAETTEYGMSTLEAIARALGVLEGAENGPNVQSQLLELYRVKLETTLRGRGQLL